MLNKTELFNFLQSNFNFKLVSLLSLSHVPQISLSPLKSWHNRFSRKGSRLRNCLPWDLHNLWAEERYINLHLLRRQQAQWLLTAKNKPLRSLSVQRLPPFAGSGFVPPFPTAGSPRADAEHWLQKGRSRMGWWPELLSLRWTYRQWALSGPAGDHLSSAVTGEAQRVPGSSTSNHQWPLTTTILLTTSLDQNLKDSLTMS